MFETDLALDDLRFVVADVETTGGTSGEHRIIELGYCVIEGGVIVQRVTSLVNPHQPIPEFITRMTGISDEMVASAPDEEEVIGGIARELLDERTVFVAHNVGFDWGFVKRAIIRAGEPLGDVTQLCTCKLSRRLSTGLARHDLGSVASYYGVDITARHRALGDAEATAEALVLMIERARNEHDARSLADLLALQYAPRTQPRRETKIRAQLEPYLKELPDEPGVYYFLSTKKSLLYVGKAKSIAKRVMSYFHSTPLHSRKVSRMIRYIRHIQWVTTGTELGAMLLESREIKEKHPPYNVAGREYLPPTLMRITKEEFPRIELVDRIDQDGSDYFGPFRSERMAERVMNMMIREHKLRICDGPLHPAPEVRPCFQFHIKRCEAPCAALQTRDDYDISVERAKDFLANVERGAISLLRDQMEACAERLDFERAALLRDGIKEIERVTLHAQDRPLAVSETNVIVVVPTQDMYSTVEVFFVRSGRLRVQRIVSTSASLDTLYQVVDDVYYTGVVDGPFTECELDELRIITSWLYHRRDRARVVHVRDQVRADVCNDLASAVRQFSPGDPSMSGSMVR